ncbi:MAG: peptidylprolyl isomerase [Syntrophothermus sp.]
MKSLKLKLSIAFVLLVIGFSVKGQVGNDDVLMTIGGKNVTVGEFLSIYLKNNPKADSLKKSGKSAIDRKNLEEYLDLYTNFKLKVREAEDLGYDTVGKFKNELNGYREQLAKVYFVDEPTLNKLIREAYDREHFDVRASHIFVKVAPDAAPADTLAAYKKIEKIRERVLKGEAFDKVAVEVSDDLSARDRAATPQQSAMKGNHGDLGYFTVFDMVYPFENGAYSTEKGKISGIIRTDYGYHIVKVTDKQPAMGKISVAHIFMTVKKDATAADSAAVKKKMDSVYTRLKDGAKWEEMVKQYSEDKGSAAKGGKLPKFGVNRMVPEFIDAIYKLKKVNDFSTPVQTPYGWHIIRLEEKKTPGTFEEEKNELKQKVEKDSRYQLAQEVVYNRIKKDYGFTEYPEAKAEFYTVVTDSVFFGKWNPELAKNLRKPLFKIGNNIYNQEDFTMFISSRQKKMEKGNIPGYVNKLYKELVNNKLIATEDFNLERKYPDFRNLMQEYHDGILLFDLTDEKVWSKAVKDTTGLKEFYEKNKTNYMWDSRLETKIYKLKNAKQVQKLRNFLTTGLDDDALLKEMNTDSVPVLSIESGKFSRKDNKYTDQISWTPGLSNDLPADTGIVIIKVVRVLSPEPKSLSEARGIITADYQNYLEKEWISALRKKYPVTVNRQVMDKIK